MASVHLLAIAKVTSRQDARQLPTQPAVGRFMSALFRSSKLGVISSSGRIPHVFDHTGCGWQQPVEELGVAGIQSYGLRLCGETRQSGGRLGRLVALDRSLSGPTMWPASVTIGSMCREARRRAKRTLGASSSIFVRSAIHEPYGCDALVRRTELARHVRKPSRRRVPAGAIQMILIDDDPTSRNCPAGVGLKMRYI